MSSAPASQPATPNPEKESELIYGLESHPPFGSSLLAALQHILAMVLSVMAPPAIVAGALGVPPEAIAYLVSMSLLFAGIGIWFQVSRPFGIGSGMLSIQATSFAFPGHAHCGGGPPHERAGHVVGAGAINSLRRVFHRRVCGHGGQPYHAVPAQDHHTHRGWHHRYVIGVSLVRVGAIDPRRRFRGQG